MAADKCGAEAIEAWAKINAHQPLISICDSTEVWAQRRKTKCCDKTSVVIVVGHRHDYQIKLSLGRDYWRNRCFLHPHIPQCSDIDSEGQKPFIGGSKDKPASEIRLTTESQPRWNLSNYVTRSVITYPWTLAPYFLCSRYQTYGYGHLLQYTYSFWLIWETVASCKPPPSAVGLKGRGYIGYCKTPVYDTWCI